jgi:hypothetical protein
MISVELVNDTQPSVALKRPSLAGHFKAGTRNVAGHRLHETLSPFNCSSGTGNNALTEEKTVV